MINSSPPRLHPGRTPKTYHARLADGATIEETGRHAIDSLRQLARSMPHTRSSEQWGELAFKAEEPQN
jgi:hypothetical protein